MENSGKIYVSKRNKRAILICLSLFLFSGLFRLLFTTVFTGLKGGNFFCITLDISIILFWMFYLKKHITQKQIRKNMVTSGVFLIAFNIVTLFRIDASFNMPVIERYLLYLYYIPMVIVPTLFFLSLVTMNSKNYKLSLKMHLLFLPAIILSLIILTNDLHSFFIRYDTISDVNYFKKNFFYYISVVYVFLSVMACFIYLLIKYFKRINIKMFLIPAAPVVICFLGIELNLILESNFLFLTSELFSLLIIGAWEGFAIIKIIPTNEGYEFFYKETDEIAFITNDENNIVYRTKNAIDIDKLLLDKAKNEPIMIDENKKLYSNKINGGYSYFLYDLKKINDYRLELEKQSNSISEYNELLEMDNKLKRKYETIKNKRIFYNTIYSKVSSKVNLIETMLYKIKPTDEDYLKKIRLIAVINVYIKRVSNLLLLQSASETISSLDLVYSIIESIDYLELYGVEKYFEYGEEVFIDSNSIIALYDAFESIVEASLPNLSAIMVYFKDSFELKISVDDPTKVIDENDINQDYLSLDYSIFENSINYKISTKGGIE